METIIALYLFWVAVAFKYPYTEFITIIPINSEIEQIKMNQSRKSVAYFISVEDRHPVQQVKGSNWTNLYSDMEYGLIRVLSKKYSEVYLIKDIADKKFILDNNIVYVFIPKKLSTNFVNFAKERRSIFKIDMDILVLNDKGETVLNNKINSETTINRHHTLSEDAPEASTDLLIKFAEMLDSTLELQ